MGRAGPVVRVRGVGGKGRKKRERWRGEKRGGRGEMSAFLLLFNVLFYQSLTATPEYIYALHPLMFIFKHREIGMYTNRHSWLNT